MERRFRGKKEDIYKKMKILGGCVNEILLVNIRLLKEVLKTLHV
jgi:hypothetical protein